MVKLNLFIDISWVEDKLSGGARYSIENILKSIILNKKFSKFKIIFILNKKVLNKYTFLKKYNKIFLTNNKIINFIIRWFLLLYLYKPNVKQLYFCPNIYCPIIKLNFKVINLFHDTQVITFPKNFLYLRRVWIYFNILLCKNRSDTIIFTSKFIKREFTKKFLLKKKKVVINIPIFKNKLNYQSRLNIKAKSYMLCLSSRLPHKNLKTIENLFREHGYLIKQKLIIAGLGTHSKPRSTKYIKYLNYITENEKNWLIKNSKFVLMPSLYEGFGMVAIESLVYGANVIASDLIVYRELVNNNINYISDPLKTKNWLSKILYLKKTKFNNYKDNTIINKFHHKYISDKYYSCFLN